MSKVKAREVDNSVERRLATGAIISTRVLRELQQLYRPEFVESPFIQQVLGWCFKYYEQYEKAPGPHIQDIYNNQKRHHLRPDDAELIGEFLSSISSEFERSAKFNSDYVIDQGIEHFQSRALMILAEDIKAHLSRGEIADAEGLLTSYKRPDRGVSGFVNPLNDPDALYRAFEESENEQLFGFSGALGEMFNDQLVRDGFLGILAPEKRGKTWWLSEFAVQAARARCNVAFFEAGDMSERQIVRRIAIRLSSKSDRPKYCGEVTSPVMDCKRNQFNTCNHKHRTCAFGTGFETEQEMEKLKPDEIIRKAVRGYTPCDHCREAHPEAFEGALWWKVIDTGPALTWREAYKKASVLNKYMKGHELRLSIHPNGTLSVRNIRAILDTWEQVDGFIPDVIVIDYIDIMAPDDTRIEFRHQENSKWAGLRALSQERHALVIGATQANAASYDAGTLKMKHFSEDKRKFAHVTGMLGLNQNEQEKRQGLMRLNWLALREGEFEVAQTVKVLQCLKMGRPHLGSFM